MRRVTSTHIHPLASLRNTPGHAVAGHRAPCPAPLLMLGYQPPGAAAQPWGIRYLQAQGCHIHHLQGLAIGTEQVPGFVVGADLE